MEAFRKPPPERQESSPELRVVTGEEKPPISWINMIAGVWEFFAAWIWGYSGMRVPFVNDLILGALIFVAAAATASGWYRSGPSWNFLFGAWLVVSPFLLGYSGIGRAMVNDVVVGLIVLVVALANISRRPILGGD